MDCSHEIPFALAGAAEKSAHAGLSIWIADTRCLDDYGRLVPVALKRGDEAHVGILTPARRIEQTEPSPRSLEGRARFRTRAILEGDCGGAGRGTGPMDHLAAHGS